MSHRSQTRRRLAVDTAPHIVIIQSDASDQTSSGIATLLESATQEILAVTYWFDPAPLPEPYPVMVRFTGHRVDVKGRMQAGDRFARRCKGAHAGWRSVRPGRDDCRGHPR